MKKIISLILCFAIVFSMTSCNENNTKESSKTNSGDTKPVEIPNPFTECDTISDAEKLTGFTFTVPESIENYGNPKIRVINNEIIEIMFINENDDKITFRKAQTNDDISGDYNNYTDEKSITVGDKTVTLKGNDGKIMTSVWKYDNFSYSVSTVGISEEEMKNFIDICK